MRWRRVKVTCDFFGETEDLISVDKTFFVENPLVFFDEINPLVDVNTLIIGIIKERDDLKNLFFLHPAVSRVFFWKVVVRCFEIIREKMSPQLESRHFVERHKQVIRKSWKILTWNFIVDITNLRYFLLEFFEFHMIVTFLQVDEQPFVIGLAFFCVSRRDSFEEVTQVRNEWKTREIALF